MSRILFDESAIDMAALCLLHALRLSEQAGDAGRRGNTRTMELCHRLMVDEMDRCAELVRLADPTGSRLKTSRRWMVAKFNDLVAKGKEW